MPMTQTCQAERPNVRAKRPNKRRSPLAKVRLQRVVRPRPPETRGDISHTHGSEKTMLVEEMAHIFLAKSLFESTKGTGLSPPAI